MRIAMWSGPRNLSTALMYSFGARADCRVIDEPFYGAWLAATGTDHPLRTDIIAAAAADPAALCQMDPAPLTYQKHMLHHMVTGIDRHFMAGACNMFLIRHPARVVASYAAKRAMPQAAEIAPPQAMEIWKKARQLGPAPVIDSADIRADPRAALTALCHAAGIEFDPGMLSWPAGGRAEDGVWARHWYGAVHRSTGFAGPEGPMPDLPEPLRPLVDAAMPFYETLHAHRLRP